MIFIRKQPAATVLEIHTAALIQVRMAAMPKAIVSVLLIHRHMVVIAREILTVVSIQAMKAVTHITKPQKASRSGMWIEKAYN